MRSPLPPDSCRIPGIPISSSPFGTISSLKLSRISKSLRRSSSHVFRPSSPPTSPMFVPSAMNSTTPLRLISSRFSSSSAGSDSGPKLPVAASARRSAYRASSTSAPARRARVGG